MIKKLFLIVSLIVSMGGVVSCSKDDPGKDGSDNPIENPSDNPSDDPADNPKEDGPVVVNSDGTTSTGVPFRREDETHFFLNYVRYYILDGHVEVYGRDEIELVATLKKKIVIPPAITIDGIKYITRGISNFTGSSVETVVLPNTITAIDLWAFCDCKSLKSINLPESVFIGYSAFLNCASLKCITIPENVYLDEYCFYGIPLEEIVLPRKLDTGSGDAYNVRHNVFNSIGANVYITAEDPDELNYSCRYLFDDHSLETSTLYVPEGSIMKYRSSVHWREFGSFQEYNP